MRQIVVWNLKHRDILYAPYATREMFACGIRYPGLWNPEYNSSNAELPKNWNPESEIHGVESRIQDCLGWATFHSMTHHDFKT